MPYPESLEIGGVRLQRWDARRDLPLLLAMAEDEGITRFVPMPKDEAGLVAMSERFAGHWISHGFGLWAARSPDGVGGGWVGGCHPGWYPDFASQVEIAWSLTASLRGRGIATAAARAAIDACFTELGLDQVIAFVDPTNDPSLAVAGRLGMERDGATEHPDGTPLSLFRLRAA